MPPSVKDGRIIAGRPVSSSTSQASSIEWAMRPRALSSPILVIASWNSSRSSALSIDSRLAPISSTPWASSTPILASDSAVFRPVCPPIVGRIASGFSFSMILATSSGVTGST